MQYTEVILVAYWAASIVVALLCIGVTVMLLRSGKYGAGGRRMMPIGKGGPKRAAGTAL